MNEDEQVINIVKTVTKPLWDSNDAGWTKVWNIHLIICLEEYVYIRKKRYIWGEGQIGKEKTSLPKEICIL